MRPPLAIAAHNRWPIVSINSHRHPQHQHSFDQVCPSKVIATNNGLRALGVFPQKSIASMYCVSYHVRSISKVIVAANNQLCPSIAITNEWSILGVFPQQSIASIYCRSYYLYRRSLLPPTIDYQLCLSIANISPPKMNYLACFDNRLFLPQHGVYLTRCIYGYCCRQH